MGFSLRRSIGTTVFDLHRYAAATGHESKSLVAELASGIPTVSLMFDASEYRARVTESTGGTARHVCGGTVTVFLRLATSVDGTPPERPPGFSDAFWSQAGELHNSRAVRLAFRTERCVRTSGGFSRISSGYERTSLTDR